MAAAEQNQKKRKRNRGIKKITINFQSKQGGEREERAYQLQLYQTYLQVTNKHGEVCRAHYLQGVFSLEEMTELHELLLDESCQHYWEKVVDKRGERMQMYYGKATQQGHASPKDPANHDYDKKAGPKPPGWVFVPHPSLEKMLHTLGLKISEVVGCRRPDIMNRLIEAGLWHQMFSFFHLFMCPAGSSPPHLDDGDWFAVIFLSHCEAGLPNSLTIESGVNISFNMRIGDVV
eukprot:scpid102977/ scgid30891/ 